MTEDDEVAAVYSALKNNVNNNGIDNKISEIFN